MDSLLATADFVIQRRGKGLTPVLDTIYRTKASKRPALPEVLPLRKSA
jgi:hypothetical protein